MPRRPRSRAALAPPLARLSAPVLALALALVLAGLALAGCRGKEPSAEEPLRRLERLAFVPVGECRIPPYLACGNAEALLVDRYEVTRADVRAWLDEEEVPLPQAARAHVASWPEGEDTLPASFLSLEEARAYAHWRGMRIPTAGEWMRIAAGTRAQPWPWGYKATSVANTLELGLRRPLAVGTFEQGRTAVGTYDMLGNVWEWVEGTLAPGTSGALAWAMGGSFLSRQRPLYEASAAGGLRYCRLELDEHHRALDLGLRCVVVAAPYVRAQSARLAVGERGRERLLAIGSAWGRAAIPLLEELAAEEGAAPALQVLLEGARR